MEIGQLFVSLGIVYAILLFAGMAISAASSGIQCQKTDIGEHAKQGAIWAVYPTATYGIATYFPVVRRLLAVDALKSLFGLTDNNAEVFGVGYIMMMVSWVATVWNVHQTEKNVCNPDAQEMTAFKQKLVAELKQKQEAEEKDNEDAENAKVKTS